MVRKTSKVGGKTYAYYLCATHKDSKSKSKGKCGAGNPRNG